jgi:hypothetical protein
MIKNKSLGRYDIKHNNFGDEGMYYSHKFNNFIGIQFFIDILGELANHVFEIEISERISKQTLADFREKLLANKPKKGKKRKGKKKKKK